MIGFFGTVYTSRPNIQMLGPAIRMDQHETDDQQHAMLARAISAFRVAFDDIKQYYEIGLPNAPEIIDNDGTQSGFYPPGFDSYTELDQDGEQTSTRQKFEYTGEYREREEPGATDLRGHHKLVFWAKQSVQGKDVPLCVKFVKRYGRDAHLYCASVGFAPKLLGFEDIGGGWFMVVMQKLTTEQYSCGQDILPLRNDGLKRAFTNRLAEFHNKGYVHGDIRIANVMVSKDGKGCMLLDFDWSGKAGHVCYPWDLNTDKSLKRPGDATPLELISAFHDRKMADNLFI